jgi:putative transposase
LRLHQKLYNAALEQRIWAWKWQRHSITFAEQCRENTALRRECPEYQALNSHSCQSTLKRLDRAFGAFFRRVKAGQTPGFPRFKSLGRYPGWGYTAHGDGWKLLSGEGGKHGRIRLLGMGTLKLRGKARSWGTAKTCEVLHRAGRWYASVTLECQPIRTRGEGVVGVDWGVETLATLAREDQSFARVENPRHLKLALEELRERQRLLARKQPGSKNREKARKRVAVLHQKVANQRQSFLHQASTKLVASAGAIATEKLNIRNLTRSARGSLERPGRRVKQKAGLNREILSCVPRAVSPDASVQSGRGWYRVAGGPHPGGETVSDVRSVWTPKEEAPFPAHPPLPVRLHCGEGRECSPGHAAMGSLCLGSGTGPLPRSGCLRPVETGNPT